MRYNKKLALKKDSNNKDGKEKVPAKTEPADVGQESESKPAVKMENYSFNQQTDQAVWSAREMTASSSKPNLVKPDQGRGKPVPTKRKLKAENVNIPKFPRLSDTALDETLFKVRPNVMGGFSLIGILSVISLAGSNTVTDI